MAIIAFLVAVMVDRYAQYAPSGKALLRVRPTAWLNVYLFKGLNLLEKVGIKNNYLILLSIILPLCISLLLLKLLFGLLFGSIGTLLFLCLSLFYFLGNRDVGDKTSELVAAHETSFGVMFWFAILGPTGALVYWFLVVGNSASFSGYAGLHATLSRLHGWAAWIPARITGFIYALVGNFGPGCRCWINSVCSPNKPSSQVLQECGHAALDSTTVDDESSLVARAFIAWVVVCILIVAFK